MPQHLRWHSAYLAFDMHPEWEETAPPETDGVLYGDDMAWNTARNMWRRFYPDNPSYVCKRFPEFPLFGVHDRIMHKAFVKFAKKHPRYMAELYFIHKPRAIYNNLAAALHMLPAWWLRGVAGAAAVMGVCGFAAAMARRRVFGPVAIAGGALLLLLVASNMPAMFAYPSYMAETRMLLLALMAFGSCAVAACAGALIGKAARKPFFNTDTRAPAEIG